MIGQYLEKRNHAVVACACVSAVVLWRAYGRGAADFLQVLLGLGAIVLMIAACWYYLLAKQRHAVWLLLVPLNVVAFLVYRALEDRSQDEVDVACPVCKAPNFPDHAICRVCKSPLNGATPIEH
jgi:hypothetical protein